MPLYGAAGRVLLHGSPLDYNDGLVQFSLGDAANVTLDGSFRVSQWNDLSGNGAHWLQTDPNTRPTRTSTGFNGKLGVVISNANGSFMTSSPTIPAGGTPHTMIVAARATATQPGAYQGILTIGGSSGNLQSSTIGADINQKLWFGGPGFGLPIYDLVVNGTTYILAKRTQNLAGYANDRVCIDNKDKGVFQQPAGFTYSISPANSAILGKYYSGGTTIGFWSIGLTAIWTRILSDAELRSIYSWIKQFYSLTTYIGNERV